MKKILLFLLIVCCSSGLFAQNFNVAGIEYFITSNNPATVSVVDGSASTGAVNIPDIVINPNFPTPYTVTAVNNYAFSNASGLTSIILPQTLTSIGPYAFNSCNNLSYINIPDTVTNIGNNAFENCFNLSFVVLPQSLTAIPTNLFINCQAIQAIDIPATVTSIQPGAFANCTGLTSFTVNWNNPLSIVVDAAAFQNTDASKINLNVTNGTAAAYASLPVWSDFNNFAPTDISLSSTSVPENVFNFTTVGTLSSTDEDSNDTFTYELVAGTGDTDNSSFGFNGFDLTINERPNYEVKNSYSIRVKTTDKGGKTFEKILTITITDDSNDDVTILSTPFSNVTCTGLNNGQATINIGGGSQALTYTWVPNVSYLKTANNLAPGTYTVTVRGDLGGDTVSHTFTITAPVIDPVTVVTPQTLCGNLTFADLVPPASDTVRWYPGMTGEYYYYPNQNVSSQTYYVANVSANGCVGPRTAVVIDIARTPNTSPSQYVCGSGTINDLNPQTSATVSWFADATTTTPLDPSTVLTNNTTYYVSQTNTIGCPVVRTAVTVRVNPIPDAPALPAQKTVCAGLTFNDVFPDFDGQTTWYTAPTGEDEYSRYDNVVAGTYYVSIFPDECESLRTMVALTLDAKPAVPTIDQAVHAQDSDIIVTVTGLCGISANFYSSGETDENGNYYYNNYSYRVSFDGTKWILKDLENDIIIAENTTTVAIGFPPTTGWVTSAACGGDMTLVFKDLERVFCLDATVADIIGNDPSIEVFDNDDELLSSNAPLYDEQRYYVKSKNANGCYSDTIVLEASISEPIQPFVTGITSDTSDLIITMMGCDNLPSGRYIYDGMSNGRNKYFCEANPDFVLNYSPLRTYNWHIENTATSQEHFYAYLNNSDVFPPVDTWDTSLNACGRDGGYSYISKVSYVGTQTFCGNAIVSDLAATGNEIKWYSTATGGEPLAFSTTLQNNATYFASSANEYGCESRRVPVKVLVAPVSASVTQNSGVLSASQTGATYQWYDCSNDSMLSGETNQTYTPSTTSGLYKVAVTVGDCTVTSACVSIDTILKTSNFALNSQLKIYPNPATSEINIDLQDIDDAKVEVSDTNGRVLLSQKLNATQNTVNIENLAIGIYVFKVSSSQGTATNKVIKN